MDTGKDNTPVEYGYSNNCVRDLAWAIFSPPMVLHIHTALGTAGAPEFELTPARRRWLAALDADPAPLLAFLARRHSRFLGVYFEALWRFFLTHDDEVTLLACNRQVIEDGRTVGEFDIFYRCHRRNATVHLELAVKFYLGMPIHTDDDLRQPSFWLGPNCIDRLDLKISHLGTHQLPLIGHARAQDWLQQEQLQPDIQEAAFHGYLYYPWQLETPTPIAANARRLHSFWLRDDQLEKLRGSDLKKYRIVPRLQWLCAHHAPNNEWQSFGDFRQKVKEELNGVLVQPVLCEETDVEAMAAPRRFFIAPQDWPALHWPRKKF